MRNKISQYILATFIITLVLNLSSCSLLFPRVEGIVFDSSTGNPIKGVNVKIVHSKFSVSTNHNGVFILYIYSFSRPQYVDILLSKEGYKIKIIRVFFDKNGVGKIKVILDKSINL